MNQNTRAMYDYKTARNRGVLSQVAASYVLDAANEHRLYRGAGPESIDNDSELRMKPTRLNYFNRAETELYGTAPYKTRGHQEFVDAESDLRTGFENTHMCNRHLTERHFRPHEIEGAPPVVSFETPSSTRADLRNAYCDVSSRAHSVETHTVVN